MARRHRLFAIALGLAVVPRLVVMAGFMPAALFKLDTYDYLWGATHLMPNPVNPSGYSIFLWLLCYPANRRLAGPPDRITALNRPIDARFRPI